MYLAVIGYKLSPLVKTQSNQLVDRIIQSKRSSVGMRVIPRTGFLRPIIQALKRNEIVPFLVDQYTQKNRGSKLNFLGGKLHLPRVRQSLV